MNYVFDLYGTLIDIRTDESSPALWKTLADLYGRYGSVWKAEALRLRFLEAEAAMRAETARRLDTQTPEIRLERVFEQLYLEAAEDPSRAGDMDAWLYGIANTFRALSIRRIRLFPGTEKMLRDLRAEGNRVFLLSNAQRIFTLPEIRSFGLLPCFEAMVISSDHDLCKPDVRLMERLLRDRGLDPAETVMIGNDPACDMGIAARSGVKGVLFNSGSLTEQEIRLALEKTAGRKKARDFLPGMRVIRRWRDL